MSHSSEAVSAPEAPSAHRPLHWSFLSRMDYEPCSELQSRVRDRLLAGEGPESLLFVEHPHTYTLGRNADADDVIAGDATLSARGVSVSQSTRGGQVTYHGPGQLVGYPIIDLNPDRRDLRRYVADLEQVLIGTLAELGVEAQGAPDRERIGVWVGDAKIASIGVHVKRWVTMHGFALNLHTDLEYFSGIVACGLPSVTMTSVEELTGQRIELADAAELCARQFGERFERRLEAGQGGQSKAP
ncbi:MAG: lipoyl(octanoyl) transferase LipB [Acidobacteriota bacterium]